MARSDAAGTLVLALVLLTSSAVLAGCLGGEDRGLDAASDEAGSPAGGSGASPGEAWETSLADEIGCTAAVGHYAAQTHAWYCPERDLCTAAHVPPSADRVTFTVDAEPVDPGRPGAGEWAVSVWRASYEWQHTWQTPTVTVTHTVEGPAEGTWGIHLRTQGAHVDTAWNTTIAGSGAVTEDLEDPGLDGRDCP